MKYLLPIIVFSVSLVTISFSTRRLDKSIKKEQGGFALVELFTSEGCSSCPPADAAFEEIQKKYSDKNVLVLSYHVDYWDQLGWKDIFSNALFTERQEYYSNIFRLNNIYTPQAIVNGKKEFLGSNKNKLISSIDEQLNEKPAASIKLNVVQNTEGKIDVHYSAEGVDAKKEQAILVLIQKMATNEIKKGENKGRTLHHINIVRNIFYLPLKEKTTNFTLPTGLNKEDVFVAGFIQDKRSGSITAMRSASVE
ncbi:MAG TPA: DUF1223 domain-containing protein [Chitinophagaceae bacterium]|jgi:hypothetical protein|nr:DUF1223 domain-containing protein [Chitinophagaceae bacterium]